MPGRAFSINGLALSVSHSLDSSPKVGAFGSPCKVYLYAKASPFGRGGTEGDGEGEDAGLVLRLFEILTITECIIFVKTICWNC